jgi:hypothetical protein
MSDRKFNRSFRLKIETIVKDTFIEILPPFTVEFSITRHNLAKSNEATFTIYNLNKDTRAKVVKDAMDYNLAENRLAIQFFAGYAEKIGDLIPRCFNGTIRRAYSHRQGSEFRTVIEAYDGFPSFNTQMITANINPGETQANAIMKIAKSLDGIDKVTVGTKFTDIAKRYTAILGAPQDVLNDLTNDRFYIDDGSAYALDKSETIDGEIRLIDVDNGLLGTPKKANIVVEVEMLFEPRIKPSQLIELKSATDDRFNGVYQVTGIIHRGTISGAVGGDCRTIVTMMEQKGYKVILDFATFEYRVQPSSGDFTKYDNKRGFHL